MKRTSLSRQPCSIARALDVAGEWWTPLILRDIAYGVRRFSEIQEDLGVSANVLADRLAGLVNEGILETRVYQTRPERHEYRMTEKGADLVPALLALMRWGDRWKWPEGAAPVRVEHRGCGHEVSLEVRCPSCERALDPDELCAKPGAPVASPPSEHEPGALSGRRLYTSPDGVSLAR